MQEQTPEFWESVFSERQEMWGLEPSVSAIHTRDLFVRHALKHILIPGIGYGRNARIFLEQGMAVTGIEISKTAIALAQKHFGSRLFIHHGSVTNMPFDQKQYDGIFCHALIHLLDSDERAKLIRDCYHQLAPGGYMVFSAISKKAHTYGQGVFISEDRYEIFDGVKMYFYNPSLVHAAFDKAGLYEIAEVEDVFPFFLIKCRKTKDAP